MMWTENEDKIASLNKQLQDTNLLYETYQDNYEQLLEKHNNMEKYLVEEYKQLAGNYATLEWDYLKMREEGEELQEDKEHLVNSCLGWKELAIELVDDLRISKSVTNAWHDKYKELLAAHAKALEEIVTLENNNSTLHNINEELESELYDERVESSELSSCLKSMVTEAASYRQMLSVKDKFYKYLLAAPVSLTEFMQEISYSTNSEGVSYVFCPNQHTLNSIPASTAFPKEGDINIAGKSVTFTNKSKVLFRVVSDVEDAKNRLSGLQGNNILVHSSMVKDVELCKYLYSKARNGYGYENKFIVWED